MTVEVFVANEQAACRVDCDRWATLAKAVLKAEKIKGNAELSVLFVDEETITSLNERFMHHAGPTDVLSFPIEDDVRAPGRFPDHGGPGPGFAELHESDLPTLLGDVVICPTVASAHAERQHKADADEIALLVVHGILHLLGMDHEDPDEATAMEAREQVLLGDHYVPTDPGMA